MSPTKPLKKHNESVPKKILTFDDALNQSPTNKHLLLGNGFSVALFPKIFSYGSLLEKADFSEIKKGRDLFLALETNDFESVVRRLNDSEKIMHLYANGIPIKKQMESDANKIKQILVDTIATRHPSNPDEINGRQYASCRKFLKNFQHIYTLNYDLLLYWTLMQEIDDLLNKDDGFRSSAQELEVEWQSHNKTTIHYLHGALHLYDAGTKILKYTWNRTGIPLIDQIKTALNAGRYPLIVSEGNSHGKQRKIIHNAYLHKCLRSLESIKGCLFIHGHSIDDNDTHIFQSIIKNKKIDLLMISLYGDPNKDSNKMIRKNAKFLVRKRTELFDKNPLCIKFYQAETAKVWDNTEDNTPEKRDDNAPSF